MKYPIRYRMFLPLVGMLCLAACILRTVACLTVRNIHGYFPASSLPEISAWLLVGAAVIALAYSLFHKEPRVRPLLFTHPIGIFPTGMVALSELLVCTDLIPELLTSRATFGTTSSPTLRLFLGLFLVLTVLCGLIGIGYFVMCLAVREQENDLRAWFGMAAVLFFALYAVYLYCDTTLPINATTKITSQVAYLSMAMYLLFDVRMSLGRPRYRMQVTLGLIAAALTAYAAIPSLITYIVQGAVIDHSIYETVCTLCFFLFVCARLYVLSSLPEDVPSPYLVGVGVGADADAEQGAPAQAEADVNGAEAVTEATVDEPEARPAEEETDPEETEPGQDRTEEQDT